MRVKRAKRRGSKPVKASLSSKEARPAADLETEIANLKRRNARLSAQALRQSKDIQEARQQQSAIAGALNVISQKLIELPMVLEMVVRTAVELCNADHGYLFRLIDGRHHLAASFGVDPEFKSFLIENPFAVTRGTLSGRVAVDGKVIHIEDAARDPEYTWSEAQQRGNLRSGLGVPLMREGEVMGIFALYRSRVERYSDSQIELVKTFADQAVIAIENARLLNDLQERTNDLSESLQQQTATADVLKVISRSTFELQPVFDSMAESAVRLCEAERAYIFRFDGQVLRAVASFNAGPENQDWVYRNPIPLGRHSISARAGLERRTVQVADIQADTEYSYVARDVDPIRTTLAVPMLKADELIGTITIYRLEVKPFTENQITLMETFADQAVIAIENARLFESVQVRTRELTKSLEDLRAAQDRLVQTEKLASLGQLTAGIAHEIKNPLNFVNNFSAVSAELVEELQELLSGVNLDPKLRGQIEELSGLLQNNLAKVVQHGKRADAIVKNMLLHSRSGSGERRPVDINAVLEESLNLAYHGARAEKQGFNITIERSFDPVAGEVDLFPQEITRVLLNVISNGFYAATKRKTEAGGDYEPVLLAATKNLGDRVEIRIRDNGTGISPEIKEKMFIPFFTTKPAGEGTGLGLSISHDIIVKQHAGRMEVDSQPGEFTEFRIILPRTATLVAQGGERA
jgi:signal transduction histidine kinase